MSLQVKCPNEKCQAAFERPLSDTGKIIACPTCLTPVVLPRSPEGGRAGQTLGEYKLLQPIARGGMGEVYKALQLKLDRTVAVKILTEELANDKSFLQRFEREAKNAASVNHPNLVQVYDFGQADGRLYLVMEYIEGQDLSKMVANKGKFPIPEALRIIEEAALALQEAQHRGIIHRDIKPANILLTAKGQAKVSDLGLARKIEEDMELTTTGMGVGSPYFMSPEQANDARRVDLRTDIYSLGLTLMFLLTGKFPFEGPTAYAVVLAHANQPLPRGKELGVELPDAVEALIRRMSAKKPQDRYPTYEELIADIRRVRRGEAPAGTLAGPNEDTQFLDTPTAAMRAATRAKSRRRVLAAAAVIAVIAMIAGGIYWATHRHPPVPQAAAQPPKANGEKALSPQEVEFLRQFRNQAGPPEGAPRRPGLSQSIPQPDEQGRPPFPMRELQEIKDPLPDGPANTMFTAAQAYARDNPSNYRDILARFEQVKAKVGNSASASQVEQAIKDWTSRRDAAAKKVLDSIEQEVKSRLKVMPHPQAVDYFWSFPDQLRCDWVRDRVYEFLRENRPNDAPGPGGRPPEGRPGDGPPGGGPPGKNSPRRGDPGPPDNRRPQ